jgi:hypothetical protein
MEQPYVASQQVELRVQKLPDLVIVLAVWALDDDLLRPCAALQYISSQQTAFLESIDMQIQGLEKKEKKTSNRLQF